MMKSFIYILIALPYSKPPTLDIKGTKLQVPSIYNQLPLPCMGN